MDFWSTPRDVAGGKLFLTSRRLKLKRRALLRRMPGRLIGAFSFGAERRPRYWCWGQAAANWLLTCVEHGTG